MRDLDKEALAELETTSRVVLPQFANSSVIDALLQDQMALRADGMAVDGQVGEGFAGNSQTGLERIWMHDRSEDEGLAAAYITQQFLPSLTSSLASVTTMSNGSEQMNFVCAELSYLHYEPGGVFDLHIDSQGGQLLFLPHRRAFSFILFLNSLTESQGGTLRLFPTISDDGQRRRVLKNDDSQSTEILPGRPTDIQPSAGTLVLFRSEAVPHQVLEARAPRDVFVGWLHRPYDSTDCV